MMPAIISSEADEPISIRMSPIEMVIDSNDLYELLESYETGSDLLAGADGKDRGTMSGRMEST